MKLKWMVLSCVFAVAFAAPLWSDTLILRDGTTISGTLTGATPNQVTFQDRTGRRYRYSVDRVAAVRFGDEPYSFQDGPPPMDDRRGPGPGFGNNQGYDQDRMEHVVVPPGTNVAVRTDERIDSRDVVEGQTFAAHVEQDIRGNDGSVIIPRGSDVRLITRRLEGNGDITLDVQSITVAGRRYRVSTQDEELQNHRDGVGANNRTGQFVGGGAVFGAIIGAIAGGGKGAAIGAVSGAGAGAATQIITQGREVHVPAESVLQFRLDRPLHLHLWS